MNELKKPAEGSATSWLLRSGLVSREVVLGVVGAIGLTYGIYQFALASLLTDPGSFEMAFGHMFGVGIAVLSLLPLGWALNRVRLALPSLRLRAFAWIGLALVGSGFWFRSQTVESVAELRAEEDLEVVTAPIRHDFESDLADAFRAWYQDEGLEESFYLGDFREWWSLDPNGDGRIDADAPVLRALRDMGWSERGLTLFDTDGDLMVDQVEWAPSIGAGSGQAWCMPLIKFNPGGPIEEGFDGLFMVEYQEAVPTRCNAPSTSDLLSILENTTG